MLPFSPWWFVQMAPERTPASPQAIEIGLRHDGVTQRFDQPAQQTPDTGSWALALARINRRLEQNHRRIGSPRHPCTDVCWYRGGREAWEANGLPETELMVQEW
jgi:hypothetical protein